MPTAMTDTMPARRRDWAPGGVLLAVTLLASFAALAQSPSGEHAIVLIYHHVSDATPKSTSVTPAEFDRHLQFLSENDYAVLPLADIVDALAHKKPLPPKAVALTFDDGYQSVHESVMPKLRKLGWPYTVFVSTGAIDRGHAPYMSWQQLRELSAHGATIANHTVNHEHLIRQKAGETDAAWRQRVTDDIVAAQLRLEKEIGATPKIFAHPYGEFDPQLNRLVRDLGYVAFGQQSGPAAWSSDLRSLPRFPVASAYADLASLADKLRSRPIPVTILEPASGVLSAEPGRPTLRLRIPAGPYHRDRLACYVSGQSAATVTWKDDIATIQAQRPVGAGRSKYNCTMPSATEPGVFHWYSHLWMKPHADGSWYTE